VFLLQLHLFEDFTKEVINFQAQMQFASKKILKESIFEFKELS